MFFAVFSSVFVSFFYINVKITFLALLFKNFDVPFIVLF